MENLNYRKIFFEFVSISFAVFLGLMMNQCRDSYNNKQLANQLLNNILTEVTDNKELVSKLLDNHQYIIGEIDSVLFRHENGIDEGDISADLSFSIVNSTAWKLPNLPRLLPTWIWIL